jgi:hypothetical protein
MEGFFQPLMKTWLKEHINKRSNHNAKEKGYPSIYPSFGPSRSFPFLTKSNPYFIFPPIPIKYNYLFYLMSLLGFVILLT